jgi:hypothetical protein
LITPKLFRGQRTMRIYGENHRLIAAIVEVAWTPHALAIAWRPRTRQATA